MPALYHSSQHAPLLRQQQLQQRHHVSLFRADTHSRAHFHDALAHGIIPHQVADDGIAHHHAIGSQAQVAAIFFEFPEAR